MTSYAQSSNSMKNVSAVEFKSLIEKAPGVLIDTRTQKEFNAGFIKGAELYSLVDPQIAAKLLRLPKDKTIYTYCYSGARSKKVANFLAQNGYTNIVNLQGGIIDWNRNKFTVEKPANAALQAQENQFSAETYNATVSKDKLVFVDFYAPWCAPCKAMMPYINELQKEYAGKVTIVKVNADASRDLMMKKNIRGIPFLELYKNGQQVWSKAGAVSKQDLINLFEEYL